MRHSLAEVDAPLVLLAPAVRMGQGCGSCPWAGGTNPMCKSNVCAGGELPLGPRAAAAAWQPERCHLWQPEPSSGVGPAHVGAAEPQGLTPGPSRGRRQWGRSWQRIYQIQPAPAPLPICAAHAALCAPSGKGGLSLPASPGDTQPCAHEAILRARFRACSGPQSLSQEERGAVSCTDSGVFSRSIW